MIQLNEISFRFPYGSRKHDDYWENVSVRTETDHIAREHQAISQTDFGVRRPKPHLRRTWTLNNLANRFRRTELAAYRSGGVNTKQSLKLFPDGDQTTNPRRTVWNLSLKLFSAYGKPFSQVGFDSQPNFYVAEWHKIGPERLFCSRAWCKASAAPIWKMKSP